MEKITIKSGEYYINDIPNEYKNSYCGRLSNDKVKLFNFKYCDDMTIGFFHWLLKLQQPSELIVRRAMIWGYDGYMIKSGGGAIADHEYSSSLTHTIDDNGVDRDVVLIKKWGKNYEDVIITYEDLEMLYLALEPIAMRTERVGDDIAFLIKAYVKSHYPQDKKCDIRKSTVVQTIKEEGELATKAIAKILNILNKELIDTINWKDTYIFEYLSEKQQNQKYWDNRIKEVNKEINLVKELMIHNTIEG